MPEIDASRAAFLVVIALGGFAALALLYLDWFSLRRELRQIDETSDRNRARVKEVIHQRDHLARLVDSGDLAGAREVAREILEGES